MVFDVNNVSTTNPLKLAMTQKSCHNFVYPLPTPVLYKTNRRIIGR